MKQFATLTVIGRDRTGVVAAITRFLFEQRANIEALEEQVTRGQFSMTLQASWKSSELKSDSLRAAIKAACDLITKGIIVWKLKGSDGFTMERRDIETECLRRKGVPPPAGTRA